MAKKARGGFRIGAGRKTLFPGKKGEKPADMPLRLSHAAHEAVKRKAAELTLRKPNIKSAEGIKRVTLSNTIEYLIRRALKMPLED